MPPKVQQKSKEQKMAAAMAGGKGKKKKWSKGKQRDKVASKIFFDDDLYERMVKETPKMKLITPSALVERFKISGSLARKAILDLQDRDEIVMVSRNAAQWIYTRNVTDEADDE